ncbi:MAG: TonB-dependent receptor [Pseudomonadota bacterium]
MALRSIAEKFDVGLFVEEAVVQNKQSASLRGTYSAEEAFRQALKGSGLTIEATGERVYTVSAPDDSGQLTDSSISQPGREQNSSQEIIESIVVTGSRIERTAISTPAPINILTADEIERFGLTDTTEVLRFVPALQSSLTLSNADRGRQQFGLASLDLRSLGANRTLVLVNGRRHVSGVAGEATVDVSSIPEALIDRVEVQTGGGSSIYGADAVSGVVNFVLKDDFEGIDFRATTGLPTQGGGESFSGAAAMGTNFANGRGNAVISFDYFKQTELRASERSASRTSSGVLQNSATLSELLGADPAFQNVVVPDLRIGFATLGPYFSLTGSGAFPLIGAGSLEPTAGVPAVQIIDSETGAIRPIGVPLNGPGTFVFGGEGVSSGFANPQTSTTPNIDLYTINSLIDYEFSSRAIGFLELKYSLNRTEGRPPFGPRFFDIPIANDNPFIPDLARDQLAILDAEGVDTNITATRVFYDDNATRPDENERQTIRIVAGLRGDLSNAFSYEVSANYGRTDTSLVRRTEPLLDRVFAAVDAVSDPVTGQPVCRSDLDPNAVPPGGFFPNPAAPGIRSFVPGDGSCVPLNIFSQFNAIDNDAIDFAFQRTEEEYEIDQFVLNATFTGKSEDFLVLPGGAVSYAGGIEYREETSVSRPDGLLLASLGEVQDFDFQIIEGEFDVIEGFAELSVPVLSDLPLARSLTADLSVRFADYSTVGSTTSYAFGGIWQPIDDLRVRGAFNRSVRAPNIGELFAPIAARDQLVETRLDPCSPELINQGTSARPGNCAELRQGIPFPEVNGLFATQTITGGNPNLLEETADTFTVGLVYTPSFLEGFSATIDYYEIQIEDAVTSGVGDEEILRRCVDAASLNNPFCDAITRDPATAFSTRILDTTLNLSESTARGIDYQIAYRFTLDQISGMNLGNFAAQLAGTYFIEREDQRFAGFPDSNNRFIGEFGFPEHFVNFSLRWVRGALSADYGFNYQSNQVQGFDIEDLDANPLLLDDPDLGDAFVHYIGGAYQVDNNFQVSVRVNNLFDEEPYRAGLNGIGQRPTSLIGRTVQLGVTAQF